MDRRLVAGLDTALTQGQGRWSVMLEGEDPRSFLDDLVRGLKGMDGPDRRKKIPNRHRYVGLTPPSPGC